MAAGMGRIWARTGSTSTETPTEHWTVRLVDTGLDTMIGGRIRRIAPYIGNQTVCMTYGDGVADVDKALVGFHRVYGLLATVTAIPSPGRFGILDINESEQVTAFRESTSQRYKESAPADLPAAVLRYRPAQTWRN
ncbi:hypothetical protein [Bradyrhizobium sp. USDA 4503]